MKAIAETLLAETALPVEVESLYRFVMVQVLAEIVREFPTSLEDDERELIRSKSNNADVEGSHEQEAVHARSAASDEDGAGGGDEGIPSSLHTLPSTVTDADARFLALVFRIGQKRLLKGLIKVFAQELQGLAAGGV